MNIDINWQIIKLLRSKTYDITLEQLLFILMVANEEHDLLSLYVNDYKAQFEFVNVIQPLEAKGYIVLDGELIEDIKLTLKAKELLLKI